MSRNLIIVTGFGPFRGHEEVNPSWEAVKLLPEELKHAGKSFQIRKWEIPVTYADVEKSVQEIWELEPVLVIHCGVNSKINRINLETNAQNGNFCDRDYSAQCLPCTMTELKKNGTSCTGLKTNFMIEKMVRELNEESDSGRDVFEQSDDVGNYLCGFIYLKSLDVCTERTLFIHVPPISEDFSPECTSKCIEKVIFNCLEQRFA